MRLGSLMIHKISPNPSLPKRGNSEKIFSKKLKGIFESKWLQPWYSGQFLKGQSRISTCSYSLNY